MAQSFAYEATDSICYGDYIVDNYDLGLFLQTIQTYLKNGVIDATTSELDFCVMAFLHELLRFIIRIGCQCYIKEMANKIIDGLPTAYEYHNCSNVKCQQPRKEMGSSSIPFSPISGNLHELQSKVDDIVKPLPTFCTYEYENCDRI